MGWLPNRLPAAWPRLQHRGKVSSSSRPGGRGGGALLAGQRFRGLALRRTVVINRFADGEEARSMKPMTWLSW
jgi:hypothetical protein